MEEHTFPCLFSISVVLDAEAMRALACVNKQLSIEMNAIMRDQSLWRCKVENILDIIVPDDMYKMDLQIAWVTLVFYHNDPVHLLYSDNVDCVNLALFVGVDPNIMSHYGYGQCLENSWEHKTNALTYACVNGHLSVVKRLLQDERVDPMVYENAAFIQACSNGHLDIVNVLLDKGIDPSVSSKSMGYPFINACNHGGLDVVNRLLEDERVDPCCGYHYALFCSCMFGHIEIVERLLKDKRINPATIINDEFVKTCIASGHLLIVRKILEDHRVTESLTEEELSNYYEKLGS